MKFRKKPVVIEAVQYLIDQPAPKGVCALPHDGTYGGLHVHGLEGGHMEVTHRDWIITGVKGEQYPCKPDIFEATYEPVKENQNDPLA
jgi:hypothetical protein